MGSILPERRAEIGRRKRLKTRSALTDAAINIISTSGLQHCSIDAVTTAAQISRASFYNHFSTKEDLVREAARVAHDRLSIGSQMYPPSGDMTIAAFAQMLANVARLLYTARKDPRLGWLIVNTFGAGEHAGKFFNEIAEAGYQELLHCGVTIKLLKPRNAEIAHDLWIGAAYLVLIRILRSEPKAAAAIVEDMIFHVLRGMQVSEKLAAELARNAAREGLLDEAETAPGPALLQAPAAHRRAGPR